MNKPKLSVCIITYNQANYIQQSLDSVLAQEVNFTWQIIIADDYSTDNTREILESYQQKHPDLIKLILQKKNVGPEKNWLDLIAYPKSKYLLYAEGDDYFTDPTKLQRQVDFLDRNENFSICFHPVRVIYEDGSRPDEIFPDPRFVSDRGIFDIKDLLKGNFIQTNSAMYRWRFINNDLEDVFPRGIAPGDWFLHLLHAQVGKIGLLDRTMSVYRRHPKGLWWESSGDESKIWEKYGLMHLNLYEEIFKLYGADKKYSKIINNNIYIAFQHLINLENKDNLTKAIINYPNHAAYVMSELADKLQSRLEEVETVSKQLEDRIALYDSLVEETGRIKNSKKWRAVEKITRVRRANRKNKV